MTTITCASASESHEQIIRLKSLAVISYAYACVHRNNRMETSFYLKISFSFDMRCCREPTKQNGAINNAPCGSFVPYLAFERPEQVVSVIQLSCSVNTLIKKIALLKHNTEFQNRT